MSPSRSQEALRQLKRLHRLRPPRQLLLNLHGSQSVSDNKTVVPGFIRGYRIWSQGIDIDWQPRLHGVAHKRAWMPGETMVAGCSHVIYGHGTPPPDASCRCGLYAKYLPQNLNVSFVGEVARPKIPGIIDAWGNTILGTAGFRAQKAVIRALWVEPTIEPFIRAAGEFYQVPVFDTLEEALEEFPPTDVSELVDTGTWTGAHAAVMAIDPNAEVNVDSKYMRTYAKAIRKAFNLPPDPISRKGAK